VKAIRDKRRKPRPGHNDVVRRVDKDTFRALLAAKLHEEAAEINDAPFDVNEYADLKQVWMDLAALNGLTEAEIEAARIIKYAECGGFRGRWAKMK